MSLASDRFVQQSKVSFALIGYSLLCMFLLMLAGLTYQHGDGPADLRAIVTAALLFGVFLITAWLILDIWRDR